MFLCQRAVTEGDIWGTGREVRSFCVQVVQLTEQSEVLWFQSRQRVAYGFCVSQYVETQALRGQRVCRQISFFR